jgi:hypothetical protein
MNPLCSCTPFWNPDCGRDYNHAPSQHTLYWNWLWIGCHGSRRHLLHFESSLCKSRIDSVGSMFELLHGLWQWLSESIPCLRLGIHYSECIDGDLTICSSYECLELNFPSPYLWSQFPVICRCWVLFVYSCHIECLDLMNLQMMRQVNLHMFLLSLPP